jgi:hypothetical protein
VDQKGEFGFCVTILVKGTFQLSYFLVFLMYPDIQWVMGLYFSLILYQHRGACLATTQAPCSLPAGAHAWRTPLAWQHP